MPKENNSYLKMKDYFEDLVSKSVHVKSFAGYFSRELLAKSNKNELPWPYLALFDYELTLSGPEQNTISVRKISFAVMYKKAETFEEQYKAIDDAEKIINIFISRIRLDSANPEHFLYRSFQKENTLISPVELENSAFGSEVTLEFKNNQTLKAYPEDWNDDFLPC